MVILETSHLLYTPTVLDSFQVLAGIQTDADCDLDACSIAALEGVQCLRCWLDAHDPGSYLISC